MNQLGSWYFGNKWLTRLSWSGSLLIFLNNVSLALCVFHSDTACMYMFNDKPLLNYVPHKYSQFDVIHSRSREFERFVKNRKSAVERITWSNDSSQCQEPKNIA